MSKNTHILFEYDYLHDIKSRLSRKSGLINASEIHRATKVPRPVIDEFIKGRIPTTSFNNIVKLYKYLELQNI